VADEIRKLAAHSKKSAKDINQSLLDIKKTVFELTEKISSISLLAQKQAASTEETFASIHQLHNCLSL